MTTTDDLGIDPARFAHLDSVLHRYVDEGHLPGVQTAVARRGQVVHRDCYGATDVASGTPVKPDTIYRIYSMTKPITSVALMMLFEEGHFLLDDPVERWIPELADLRVWVGGTAVSPETRPAAAPITVHQLLTHTAGLTYGFQHVHPVDEMYRQVDVGDFTVPTYDLDEMMARLGELPLLYEPGTRWGYSVATDVCGALIERISGERLDVHLERRVLGPLGMVDTRFHAPADDAERCSVLYATLPGGEPRLPVLPAEAMTAAPTLLSGGGGLVGTTDDYLRFCHLLLGGGELDGVRLLSPRTLALMTRNHLPGGRDLNSMGQATFSETEMAGMGFGLGFSVLLDGVANRTTASEGAFAWGGAASTAFWVDPVAEVCVVFMTQLLPSGTHPIRKHLQTGVYQALLD